MSWQVQELLSKGTGQSKPDKVVNFLLQSASSLTALLNNSVMHRSVALPVGRTFLEPFLLFHFIFYMFLFLKRLALEILTF